MTEETVCIGDIYQFGEAIVQISQPRQPCYKLAMKLERADMPVMVQETGFTGYYFRVIQEGVVEQASTVQLIERHPLERTVANANDIKYKAKDNIQGLHNILAIEALSDSWRESFERKLNKLRS
jgi:MOSC domain-containing protein YiiM